eukprot:scaffold6029_cov277-Pinguiococcus_pyrenoidosus.AAC.4
MHTCSRKESSGNTQPQGSAAPLVIQAEWTQTVDSHRGTHDAYAPSLRNASSELASSSPCQLASAAALCASLAACVLPPPELSRAGQGLPARCSRVFGDGVPTSSSSG